MGNAGDEGVPYEKIDKIQEVNINSIELVRPVTSGIVSNNASD